MSRKITGWQKTEARRVADSGVPPGVPWNVKFTTVARFLDFFFFSFLAVSIPRSQIHARKRKIASRNRRVQRQRFHRVGNAILMTAPGKGKRSPIFC